jgi:transposase
MTTWLHERLFRRSQTKDSLRCIERGMSKSQTARTFDVSLSSVKRCVKKADHGESLAPKNAPGSLPKLDEKASRLPGADLSERPYVTLQERRDYIEAVTGPSVSRSSVCRAIARIGSTRKKGGRYPPSVTSSRGQLGS